MNGVDGCYSCRQEALFAGLPPRELIAADEWWRAAHAIDTGVLGWLVLIPRRHVTSIADLTDAEAATLGAWQVRLSRALHAVTGCVKTYVAQFAEAPGFQHVHFHVVPRFADLPDDALGPRIFLAHGDAPVHDEQMHELALQLRTELAPLRD